MLLQEVSAKVAKAEAKMAKTAEVGAMLTAGHIDEVDVERLKRVTTETLEYDKAGALAIGEALKALVLKKKDQAAKESPVYMEEMGKLEARLSSIQQESVKLRKAAVAGQKVCKGKQILREKDEEMQAVEKEITKAEILTTPLGDERPSDSKIEQMDAAVAS